MGEISVGLISLKVGGGNQKRWFNIIFTRSSHHYINYDCQFVFSRRGPCWVSPPPYFWWHLSWLPSGSVSDWSSSRAKTAGPPLTNTLMVSEEDAGSAGTDHYHLGGPGRVWDQEQLGVGTDDGGGPGAVMDPQSWLYTTKLSTWPGGI